MQRSQCSTSAAPAPILRWAGGKRWLAPQLARLTRTLKFDRYHEPFLGGGSIFLALSCERPAFLSDLNSDLIATYDSLRHHPDEVFDRLKTHQNESDYYYALRSSSPAGNIDKAARFIFLNHTSFNGIYRVNLDGRYNVPYGRRHNLCLPTLEHLRNVARSLGHATLSTQDFEQSLKSVEAGDLVFLDPPYTVSHNRNGFVKYNQNLFSFDDQRRLSRGIDRIRDVGAHYILTNAAHESIATLFEKGDVRRVMHRKNAVGGSHAIRGIATEYLFTNIEGTI